MKLQSQTDHADDVAGFVGPLSVTSQAELLTNNVEFTTPNNYCKIAKKNHLESHLGEKETLQRQVIT